MRFGEKDIIFDDDVDVIDNSIINGYLWATDKLVELAGYEDHGDDDYINFYPSYDINKDKWYVKASGVMESKYFSKELKLTENELDYIANQMIEYYFNSKENWNDFVNEVKTR